MYDVQILHDVRIPVRDGVQLSANLFLPVAKAPGERFAAILEMIPYRKDDWRYNTDYGRMTWLARHGYGCCRLDIRGTGSSQGVAYDEYTEEETLDGCDAVAWLAGQTWCSGSVGMWGVSYGGFTAIQVAKRQPPALKAIFPVYATDDRYTDDVHYLGGCKTASEMAQYAVSQVAMNALPRARPMPARAGRQSGGSGSNRRHHGHCSGCATSTTAPTGAAARLRPITTASPAPSITWAAGTTAIPTPCCGCTSAAPRRRARH